jgi:arsenite transporter
MAGLSTGRDTGHEQEYTTEKAPPLNYDLERNAATSPPCTTKASVYAGLGWLDRLLVLWILLAIVIGILLGNFVDSAGPALQRGHFVGVSIPIGK